MLPGPVCVSLTPSRVADVFASSVAGADCVEVRLDYLEDPEEASSAEWGLLGLPVIATCRGRAHGGRFEGSIDDEVRLLAGAAARGAAWVDLDFRIDAEFPGAHRIASHHDFGRTPEDLDRTLEAICRGPGDVAKVATMVRSWSDNRRLLELVARRWPKPVIMAGMGDMGQVTRIVGPSRGSALTFASAGRDSAPGQLGLAELLETYRIRRIGPSTRLVGIVGNPVGHSRSPLLHNRAFEAAGLDYVYLKLPVEDAGDFFENAERIGIVGFSVTIPHKIEVMRYLDEVTPEARAVGAVNTVYRRDGKWMGDNTDVYGIRQSLAGFDPRGKRVLILGTGGAARAAVAALAAAASITLLSRSLEPGTLEWSRPVAVDRIENLARHDADLLVNASPVGMFPRTSESPVPGRIPAAVVFDMVYNPPVTRLLREAEAQGRKAIPGTTMFVAQAARQFEIWTGLPASGEVFAVGAV